MEIDEKEMQESPPPPFSDLVQYVSGWGYRPQDFAVHVSLLLFYHSSAIALSPTEKAVEAQCVSCAGLFVF